MCNFARKDDSHSYRKWLSSYLTRIKEIEDITSVQLYWCDCNTLAQMFFICVLLHQHTQFHIRALEICIFDACTLSAQTYSSNEHGSDAQLHNNILVKNLSTNQLFCTITIASNSGGLMFSLWYWMTLNEIKKFITCNIFFSQHYSLQTVPHIIILTTRWMNEIWTRILPVCWDT